MAVDLRGRDFISLADFTKEEILQMVDTAQLLKVRHKAGEKVKVLEDKTLGLIFTKPSTRTRIAFEVAMRHLGGSALFLSANDLQLRRGETIADTARVLSRYLDGIMIRTFDHQDVVDLAAYGSIPVINGLTDLLHPCQILADLLTIKEKRGRVDGLRLAYMGDGNNVTHSLMLGGALVGLNVVVGTPKDMQPDPKVVAQAQSLAKHSGAEVVLTADPVAAVSGADVVYTDVWTSMGQDEGGDRLERLAPFQVNETLLGKANPDALFMHCLPAHRGEEVTDQVMDGPQSVVFDQAENRLHAHKAILALVM